MPPGKFLCAALRTKTSSLRPVSCPAKSVFRLNTILKFPHPFPLSRWQPATEALFLFILVDNLMCITCAVVYLTQEPIGKADNHGTAVGRACVAIWRLLRPRSAGRKFRPSFARDETPARSLSRLHRVHLIVRQNYVVYPSVIRAAKESVQSE